MVLFNRCLWFLLKELNWRSGEADSLFWLFPGEFNDHFIYGGVDDGDYFYDSDFVYDDGFGDHGRAERATHSSRPELYRNFHGVAKCQIFYTEQNP